MEHADGKFIAFLFMEKAGHVFLIMHGLIAGAINSGYLFPVNHKRNGCYFISRENMHGIRQGNVCLPGFLRIVVPMNDKNLDSRLRGTEQFSGKGHLCCQAVMITVIYVSGDENCISPFFCRNINHGFKGFKRCLSYCLRPRAYITTV